VFDHLRVQSVGFDELRKELRIIVLKQARSLGTDDLATRVRSIATDIVTSTFDSDSAFSGNVDARELRRTAKRYGYATNRKTEAAASSLLIVKTHRNDLAHGNKTFADIGRDTTVEELRRHSLHAILYMREVIRQIEDYLDKQRYLAVNAN
jgi:hypothetical protein